MSEYYKGREYWSVMSCWSPRNGPRVEHPPHVWNSEHCLYGPYLCRDFPEPPEYIGKHRAPTEVTP